MVLDYKVALVLSGCSNALGLEDGRVQDSQLSSNQSCCTAFKGRLNYNDGGWCSDKNEGNHEFLQIDLLNVQHISRIATQGVRSSYPLWRSYYVKTFVIKYSYDGTTWFPYKGSDGSIQVSSIFSLNSFL